TFLSALVPARGGTWAQRPSIDPIDPERPDRGLVIDDIPGGERYEVVFSDTPDGESAAAGLRVVGMAGVRKLRGRAVERAMLAAGRRLEIDGVAWIEVLEGDRASVEVEPTASGLNVSGDEIAIRIYAPGAQQVRWNGREVAFDREGDWIRLPATGGPDEPGD